MKTSKVKLPFTQEADTTICPHCNREYVIYAILRGCDEYNEEVWPQVGGYCYMCGKPTDKQTEKIQKLQGDDSEVEKL